MDDDVFEVLCEPGDLAAVRAALDEAGVEVEAPRSPSGRRRSSRSTRTAPAKLLRLIEALEDQDDVDAVHANFDVDADVLERVAG